MNLTGRLQGLSQQLNLGQCDFLVIALTTILVIFGLVMVFSASYYKSINDNGSPYDYLINQGINAIGGFGLMAFFSVFDYHKYKRFCNLIMLGSIVLLLLVLTPLGVGAGGDQSFVLRSYDYAGGNRKAGSYYFRIRIFVQISETDS